MLNDTYQVMLLSDMLSAIGRGDTTCAFDKAQQIAADGGTDRCAQLLKAALKVLEFSL